MNFKKTFLYLLFFVFVVVGFYYVQKSKRNARLLTSEATTVVELSSDFVDFYKKFHSDSLFQLGRISFPLQGVPAMIDKNTNLENFSWSADNWDIHKTFNDFNGTYIREFDNIKGIVTERIYDTGHRFEMRKRYSKLGDEWYLIYYAAMNPSVIYQ